MCRAIGPQDYPASKLRIATHTAFTRDHYPSRIAEFVRSPLNCGEIVMLGDSLTERHDWGGSLAAQAVVRNRGIAGDTTDGVLARLDEIIAAQPRALFIMIGTNDLWSTNSAKRTVGNIEKMILAVKGASPRTRIFVQTVLPIRSDPQRNDKVRAINAKLRDVAGMRGASLIDTYSMAVDGNGSLRAEFTDDGVHLTATGYAAWVALLNAALSENRGVAVAAEAQHRSG
jgi:lysophospholipase L1-like esterase